MIKIPLKTGHCRPASETPFKWCFAGMLMNAERFFRGSGPLLLKTQYFCNFSGGGGSLWICAGLSAEDASR